ncbi:MAG: hypothetical protein AB1716_22750, partial [Planctomycetota bacterium]
MAVVETIERPAGEGVPARSAWGRALLGLAPGGAGATCVQLVLIAVWHPAVLVVSAVLAVGRTGSNRWGWDAEELVPFWISSDPLNKEVLAALSTLVTLGAALMALVGYPAFRRHEAERSASGREFVTCWWYTCLWGSVIVPGIAVLSAMVWPEVGPIPSVLSVLVLALAGPAAAARWRGKLLKQRWRPMCPECGYSLRGLASARCPECGEDLPAVGPGSRRWAVRRLVWDRR